MADPILRIEESNRLINMIQEYYDFQDGPRSRREIIKRADLGKFLPRIDLSGSAGTFAADLVHRLSIHGFLVERPAYHALGALLAYLLTCSEPEQEDKRYMAGLIVRYGLVRDPAYLDELHSAYQISEAPPVIGEYGALPKNSSEFSPPLPFEPQYADREALEAVINSQDNFLDLYDLLGAIYSAQAVARVEVPQGRARGTGFLIGPDLFLTNQHVLLDEEMAARAVLRFDYYKDGLDVPQPGRVFHLKPGFYHASPPQALDYALVQVDSEPLKEMRLEAGEVEQGQSILELIRAGKHRGYLLTAPALIRANERVNIIQHPRGDSLKVVLTLNYVTADMQPERVWYRADTDHGSSGSPVFNDKWEVVALHHSYRPAPGADGKTAIDNEGIPMRAILEDLRARNLEGYLPRK